MPDWMLSIFMLVIWLAVAGLFVYFTEGLLGAALGLAAGYLVSSQVIQLLPGFWKKHK